MEGCSNPEKKKKKKVEMLVTLGEDSYHWHFEGSRVE